MKITTNTENNEHLLTIEDVTQRIAISRAELYREFDRGKLHKIKRGRRSFVSSLDVRKYISDLKK